MALQICNYIAKPDAGGKFIVLLRPGGDDGIVALSDFSRDCQHRDIVRRWERENRSAVAAAGLRVAGGGWWRLEGADTLVLYGQSGDYGRFDPAWLRSRLRAGMVGGESRIDIR